MTHKAAITMEWVTRVGVPVLLAILTFMLNQASQELRDLRTDIKTMRIEFQAKFEKLQVENAVLNEKITTHLKARL